MTDTYLTVTGTSTGEYTEKRSKFLAFAHHVEDTEDIKSLVASYERKYHDARHVCYAYMLGKRQEQFRTVDNGEPCGTAGKPILGRILSHNLTNILIVVVRYFGGIKLGTSGLIDAYQQAAEEAISAAQIEEKTIDTVFTIHFEYLLMNQVMRVVKDIEPQILSQDFQLDCVMKLAIRNSEADKLQERLTNIRGLQLVVEDEDTASSSSNNSAKESHEQNLNTGVEG